MHVVSMTVHNSLLHVPSDLVASSAPQLCEAGMKLLFHLFVPIMELRGLIHQLSIQVFLFKQNVHKNIL